MLCYRDKTFCSFSDCKEYNRCHRAITQEVKDGANRIGLPICRFVEQPDCFQEYSRSMRKRLDIQKRVNK
jgi:hypothetical protein